MAGISHDRRGAGTPIVLVHGIGSRWQCFEPILDQLAEQHETIAVDLPGFGASPLVDGVRPGPRGYADWLAGWLADNDIDRPHLVGSSMGGGIGLELGRRGIASGVTAFSPVGFWGTPGLRWTQAMLTGIRSAAVVAEPVMGRMLGHRAGRGVLLGSLFGHPTQVSPDSARADVAALAAATAFPAARKDFGNYHLSVDDDPGSLPDIAVTVAWGTRDVVLIHRTQSARARAALPFARHLDLAGCGHLPFNDDPVTCARVVLADAATRKEA
ncbi:MAG: alpha/beta hydrolase [Propionibacteriales bacterium]|nr:alpha/beta hydrolase [Propionibacteriales bacterium]